MEHNLVRPNTLEDRVYNLLADSKPRTCAQMTIELFDTEFDRGQLNVVMRAIKRLVVKRVIRSVRSESRYAFYAHADYVDPNQLTFPKEALEQPPPCFCHLIPQGAGYMCDVCAQGWG